MSRSNQTGASLMDVYNQPTSFSESEGNNLPATTTNTPIVPTSGPWKTKCTTFSSNCMWRSEENTGSDTKQAEGEDKLQCMEVRNAPTRAGRFQPPARGTLRSSKWLRTPRRRESIMAQGASEFNPWGHRDLQTLPDNLPSVHKGARTCV